MHTTEKSDRIRQIVRLINKKILDELTSDEKSLLEEWLQEDPRNKQLLEQLMDCRTLEQGYKQWKSVDTSRPLADMKARTSRLKPLPFYHRRWFRYVAAAVMIGLVGGLGWYLNPLGESLQETARQVQATDSLVRPGTTRALLTLANGEILSLGADEARNEEVIHRHTKRMGEEKKFNDLVIPRGGEFKIVLEDGTQVWLNAESRLHYPDTFDTQERRVRVEGEAYFKVAHDEEKPFYVETAGQLIRVYGTEFNVYAYQEEDDVRTTLVSGSIALRPLQGSGAELILTPGHQAVFNKESELTSVRSVDTETVTGWRRGVFVFEEQNLEQIMRALSRWYDFDYQFEAEDLRSLVFMGSVPRYGSFSEVLEILSKSSGLHFRLQDRTLSISN